MRTSYGSDRWAARPVRYMGPTRSARGSGAATRAGAALRHPARPPPCLAPQVWSFFLQAALGVQYLHRNHVLHRCGECVRVASCQRV